MIGTLLGFLAMFGFGAIYYGLLTAEAGAEMAANFASCMNAEPNMAFVILGPTSWELICWFTRSIKWGSMTQKRALIRVP